MTYCQAGFIDYYAILEVSRDATLCEIKQRYRRLAFQNHPDRIRGGAQEKAAATLAFQRIAEAFQTLGKCEKRRIYDVKYDAEHRKRTRVVPLSCGEGRYSARASEQCMGLFQDPFEVYEQFFKNCPTSLACPSDDQVFASGGIDPCDYVFSKARSDTATSSNTPASSALPTDIACQKMKEERAEYRARANQLRRMEAGAHAADGLSRPADGKRRARSWEETEIAEGDLSMVIPNRKKPCNSSCALIKITDFARSSLNAFSRRIRHSFDASEGMTPLLQATDTDCDSLPETIPIEETDPEALTASLVACAKPVQVSCEGAATAGGVPGSAGQEVIGTCEEMSGKPLCKLQTSGKGGCCDLGSASAMSLGSVKKKPCEVTKAKDADDAADFSDDECPIGAFFKTVFGSLTKGRSANSVGQADDARGDLSKKIKDLEDDGFERGLVLHALEKADGNLSDARKLLENYEDGRPWENRA